MGASVIGVLLVLLVIVAGVVLLMVKLTSIVTTMAVCFILVSLLMMLVILIQKPKGGGLSGAFGGAGGSEAAFGAKTGDVLTVATICLFILFLGLAMGLTIMARPSKMSAVTTKVHAPAKSDLTQVPLPGEPAKETPEETVTVGGEKKPSTPAAEAPAPSTQPATP